eukprot:gnl/Hemi2/23915_TR8028_c0_g1_i1.p1 gnl/Hemi2/23915_TR8028_c0_g1~~gnl/Hemi2/23915_TR8028_c0_g1_i1.p1  ORF type:complete len:260 (-),score=98.81 gnl/Hemi2/23915_TR8028_c0_g1_i1:278-1057(-)
MNTGGMHGGGNDFVYNIQNNAAAQFGLQYGTVIADQGAQYLRAGLGRWVSLDTLRYYFTVDNSYVVNKLAMILCPFLYKGNWLRQSDRRQGQPLPPRDDINAPDLYIPTMAFVTYVLLVCFIMGHADRFSPEHLGMTATCGLAVVVLETAVVKLGLYILNARQIPFWDEISYSGYKFVGIVLSCLCGFLFGTTCFWVSWLATSGAMVMLLINVLKRALLPDHAGIGSYDNTAGSAQNYFVLVVAGLQPVWCWALGFTRI